MSGVFGEGNEERQMKTKRDLVNSACRLAAVKTTHVSDSSKCSSISRQASVIDTPSASLSQPRSPGEGGGT